MRRSALGKTVLLGWVGLTFLILFAPLLTTILMSFNSSELGSLPFHFSLRWYSVLFANSDLLLATSISFQLAVAVTVTSALVGSMLALWLSNARPSWALPVNGAVITAVTVPWLILATSMLLLFNQLGLGRSLTSLYIGDLAVCLPYVVLVVAARLRATDPSIAQAARSLGAGQLVTFVKITLPMAAPAIVAGSLMSFIVCFNNFTMQFFLAPLGVQTLPTAIYTLVRVGYRPDINALCTILVAASVVLVLLLQRASGNAAKIVSGQNKN
jgi:ABC-type spermidine/putrescine transport system permease subunit II